MSGPPRPGRPPVPTTRTSSRSPSTYPIPPDGLAVDAKGEKR
ncbi:hypothetical protein [Streptomyces cyaneofuscatus]